MYEIAYAELIRRAQLTKEQGEAAEAVEDIFADADWEWETGLPAIARRFGDASTKSAPTRTDGKKLPIVRTARGDEV